MNLFKEFNLRYFIIKYLKGQLLLTSIMTNNKYSNSCKTVLKLINYNTIC